MLAALAGACLLVAGCMPTGALQKEVEAEVAREGAEVGRRLAGQREAGRTGISHAGRPWYGTADNSMRPLRDGDPRGVPLPGWLEERDAIAVTIGAAVPIEEAASIVSAAAGIPVSVETTVTGPDGTEIGIPVRGGRAITHEGRLSALLDRIAGEYDLTWRHDGRQIRLLAVDTRGWTVPLPVGETEISASSGGLSGSGDRTVSLSSSSSQDPWAALAAQLRAAVRPPASVVTVPDNGRVMVTGRPSDIAAAEAIIADWTRLYSQRITIEVGIYQIDAERSESFRAGLRTRSATAGEIEAEPGARAAGAARQAARIRAEAAAEALAIINDAAELSLTAVAEAEATLAEAATEEAGDGGADQAGRGAGGRGPEPGKGAGLGRRGQAGGRGRGRRHPGRGGHGTGRATQHSRRRHGQHHRCRLRKAPPARFPGARRQRLRAGLPDRLDGRPVRNAGAHHHVLGPELCELDRDDRGRGQRRHRQHR